MRCDALNMKSLHLMKKLGMREEGVLHKHLYFKYDEQGNPIWVDTCLYAVLNEKWK